MATPGPSAPAQKTGSAQNPDGKSSRIFEGADYVPLLSNWYAAKPYGFKFTPKTGNPVVMFLPISPSNLTITTQFATSIVPTIYGTVEEHSPVRYYDISIEGTTGMGPRYVYPFEGGGVPQRSSMRSSFTVQQAISAQGFFAKTLNTVHNTRQELAPVHTPTALQLDQTGYAAFHNFYRFLLKYKKDASGTDANQKLGRDKNNGHPLIFFNYKDNNQYRVAIRQMTLRRDSGDPMLYHYSISMRGYDLATVGSDTADFDHNQDLADLGLGGIDGAKFLGTAKEAAVKAKSVLGSVANGINQLGR